MIPLHTVTDQCELAYFCLPQELAVVVGVTTVQVTHDGNNTVVQCNSTNLTNFAVLGNVAVTGSQAVSKALTLLNPYVFVHTNTGRDTVTRVSHLCSTTFSK